MLRQVKLGEGLAVIDLGSGAHAVSPLAQVDLVQVKFQDLVFGQLPFDLERQEDLVQFSHVRFLPRQEEIAGHLHGDGAAALPLLARQRQGDGGSQQALPIHAGVLEEAVVFRRDKGVDQLLRRLVYAQQRAPFLAKLGDQGTVPAVHPQRHLQTDIAQGVDLRQVGDHIKHRRGDNQDAQA